jgi:hypothetical protein
MRFSLGLLCGLGALGAYLGYQHFNTPDDPCHGFCGEGTVCSDGRCQPQRARRDDGKRRRRRGRRRRRRPTTEINEPQLKQPSAAQLAAATEGPTLGGADRIDLTEQGGGERELSEAEVERIFRRLDRRIIDCIDRAREGWAIDGARVVVGFRLERSGRVEKVRVSAPALMQRQGLHRCIAPLVRGLRFPPSARSLIMSYPYHLD